MDFRFTEEEEKLRQEVRQFLSQEPVDKFPVELEDEYYGMGAGSPAYSRRLGQKGWLGISWPKEYGGLGRPLMERFILLEELTYHRAPQASHFFNDSVGPSIIRHGTEKQKQAFLPNMSRGELFFCTGLSEPDAGSDMLATKTKATKNGNSYIVSGQKVWISGAHVSHWMLTLARTDPEAPKNRGLSILLVDLKSPGVTVRPITNMASLESFNEVFLDDVRVPQENLLGEENKGLRVVFESLEGDRFWARAGRAPLAKRDLEDLVEYVKETKFCRESLAANQTVRHMLVELAVDIEACRLLTYKVAWLLSNGASLTHEACIVKTFSDLLAHRLANIGLQILGPYAEPNSDSRWSALQKRMTRMYAFSPGYLIAGGTVEIQKQTIAMRGLGLGTPPSR